jgi:hypothetical protein
MNQPHRHTATVRHAQRDRANREALQRAVPASTEHDDAGRACFRLRLDPLRGGRDADRSFDRQAARAQALGCPGDDVPAGLAQRRLHLRHVNGHVGPGDEGRALLRIDQRDRERARGPAIARHQLERFLGSGRAVDRQ